MLQIEHNMWSGSVLSGAVATDRIAALIRKARRADANASESPQDSDGNDPSGTAAPRKGKQPLAFVEKPLGVPHLARVPTDAGETVYLRFLATDPHAAQQDRHVVAVLPGAVQVARQAIEEVKQTGQTLDRFVIVGADRLLDQRDEGTEGHAEALIAFGQLLKALGEDRVPFVWRTRAGLRGALPIPLVEAWAEVGSLLTIEMGIPTLDLAMVRTLEGQHASEPDARLRLLSAASARGVGVRAMIDPLVPMLTDQAATLRPLLSALSDVGVHRVSCRYLMLTRERARALTDRMSSMHRALIRGVFADQPWLKPHAAGGPTEAHKLLPDAMRKKGHDRVVSEGARVGIVVDILDPSEGAHGRPVERLTQRRGRSPRAAATTDRPQLDLFGQG